MAVRVIFELTLMLVIGLLGVYASPVLINSVITHLHVGPMAAGFISSIELFSLGIVAIMDGAVISKASTRQVILAGAVLATLSQLASAAATGFEGLIVLRLLAGVGEGLIYGRTCQHASSCQRPSAIFGAAMLFANIVFAGMLAVLPPIDGHFGLKGVFITLGLLAALVLGALIVALGSTSQHEIGTLDVQDAEQPLMSGSLFFLSSVFLSNLGLSMIWTSASRVGIENNLSNGWITYALTLSTLSNIAGAAAAAAAALIFKPRPMLITGLMLGGLSSGLILFAGLPMIYVLALVLYGAAYLFIIPFQITMALQLDPRGPLPATTGGLGLIAYGCGPMAGGLCASLASYRLIGPVCAGLCVLAIGPVIFSRRNN